MSPNKTTWLDLVTYHRERFYTNEKPLTEAELIPLVKLAPSKAAEQAHRNRYTHNAPSTTTELRTK